VQRARGVAFLVGSLLLLAACGEDGEPGGPGAAGEPGAAGAADLARGEQLFAAHCAACHGPVGEGTTTGPPLVHVIYEPGHHSDASFHLAVQRGVQAHHWDFGPMPPVSGLSDEQVEDIIAHVRDLQREAGIID
jgi:mono/diheme cytochrome c family protein